MFADKENSSYLSYGCSVGVNQLEESNYKQRANIIFQKLDHLQQQTQNSKFQSHQSLLHQLFTAENTFNDNIKKKEGAYSRIVSLISQVDEEINWQKSQQQRLRFQLEQFILKAQRQFESVFDKAEKERKKSQIGINNHIDLKIESVALKNKNSMNDASLIAAAQPIEQLEYIRKESQKYYKQLEKDYLRFKKEFEQMLNDQKTALEEQYSKKYEQDEQILSFMKTIHFQISSKLKKLNEKRQQTEERVISMVEKIVKTCLSESEK